MKIDLIRERRKTIVLSLVDVDRAVLKVPKSLSDKRVSEFLDSKKKWLESKSKKLKQNELFSKSFELKKFFYLFGNKVDSLDSLIFGFVDLSDKDKLAAIKRIYLSHFSNLEKIVQELGAQTGYSYDKIKPTNSTRIWGSFNTAKVMKLNWKLLILPERLVRYVICHELCHGKHMNHKPQFWQAVAKICPDYKAARKELNQYSFLLKNEL